MKTDFRQVLRNTEPAWVVRLVSVPSRAIHDFVVWLLQNVPKFEQSAFRTLGLHDAVLKLFASPSADARKYAAGYARTHARDLPVSELIRLANRHPRVKILQPGPGVGGHCIAVDPWFIVDSAPKEAKLIRTAREVNDAKPQAVIAEVLAAAKSRSRIACLGLTYKADVDDMRESPAVEIVSALARRAKPRNEILVVDPHIAALPRGLAATRRVRRVSLSEALAAADVVVLLVGHREFRAVSARRLAGKTVIDTCGAWRKRNPA